EMTWSEAGAMRAALHADRGVRSLGEPLSPGFDLHQLLLKSAQAIIGSLTGRPARDHASDKPLLLANLALQFFEPVEFLGHTPQTVAVRVGSSNESKLPGVIARVFRIPSQLRS